MLENGFNYERECAKYRISVSGLQCPDCGWPICCSACEEPIRTKEALSYAVTENTPRFCGHCGREISSVLSEALDTMSD